MPSPVVSPQDSKILERRQQVLELYRDGLRIYEIAEEVGVTRFTVWRDMRWVHEQFVIKAVNSYAARLTRELLQIAYVESEAAVEWERSKLDATATQTTWENLEINGEEFEKVKTKTAVKTQCGDPRYLSIMLDCGKKRCKLLHLYAPENYHHLHSPPKEEPKESGGLEYLNDPGYIAYMRDQAFAEDSNAKEKHAMPEKSSQDSERTENTSVSSMAAGTGPRGPFPSWRTNG